jgi:hypothetical protein
LIKGTLVIVVNQTAVTLTADEVGSQAGKRAKMLLGDFNGNGKVDGNDLFIFADVHIKYCQGQPFNPLCDMNNDGKVDANDFFIFASAYILYWSA